MTLARKTKPTDVSGAAVDQDPAKEELWSRPGYLVRRLNQIHYAMFQEECGHENVTPVQYGILTALSLRPGIDQTEIGMELGLDRTTTADVVKRLEDKGFVRRRVNPEDRRSRQAFITPEGLKVMNRLYGGMVAASDRMLASLSTSDRRKFVELLTSVVNANDQYGRATIRGL
ncbi:MarR family transcriptional regulator [Burkholderia cenocepacia]|nr:MarR family transcriptional regulator [Burkholderia cenocepacia]RQZ85415.1 MarR family transcriptional regulator [Burkholderia cenocepacia]RRA05955.1 MarR family transcriptional regulator [Burkholderia cenocepacia]